MNLGLGLWPEEPETFVNVGMRMFPEIGVRDVGKMIEFVASILWDLRLDLLGLDEGIDSLIMYTHDLHVVCLHLLQALFVLLGKVHVP